MSSLKNDCSLFSRLFIASQIRDGDLDEFFAHENQAYPPALSNMGKMRLGTKSDMVGCLEDLVRPQENAATDAAATSPAVEVIILDGAAIINMLPPGPAKPSTTMHHKYSCHTSHLSCSIRAGWILSGMNTSKTV